MEIQISSNLADLRIDEYAVYRSVTDNCSGW